MLQNKLSAEEFENLKKYISRNGRNWKSKLRWEWAACGHTLRETRFLFGPSGLDAINVKP